MTTGADEHPDSTPRPRLRRMGRAVVAGCVATLPMTALMLALHSRLPSSERYPLPPRLITDRLRKETGLLEDADEPARARLALAGHFAYGAAAGSLYGLARPRGSIVPSGAVFGAGVWAGSYLGLLPAVGLLPPATEHPPRRTALMVAAHLVWGMGVAAITDALERRGG